MLKNTDRSSSGSGRGRDYGRYGGDANQQSPSKASLKGLFVDGVWMCNCEPRLPAERFKTRKEGANHGRWSERSKVYRCQKSQLKQCKFFLWEDEAKLREESAVANDSRPGPRPLSTPTTSSRDDNPYNTPTSNPQQPRIPQFNTPSKPPRPPSPAPKTNISCASTQALRGWSDNDDENGLDEECFEQPLSDEEVMKEPEQREERVAAVVPSTTGLGSQRPPPLQPSTTSMPPPQTPRKTPRTATITTPGKRARSPSPSDFPTPTTPSHFSLPPVNRTLFPSSHSHQPPTSPLRSTLTHEILTLLSTHNIALLPSTAAALSDICNMHTLRAQGIARGRDVSRDALRERERRVGELRRRVEELEAERERDRVVIGSLRRERSSSGGRVGEAVGGGGECLEGEPWEEGDEQRQAH